MGEKEELREQIYKRICDWQLSYNINQILLISMEHSVDTETPGENDPKVMNKLLYEMLKKKKESDKSK